ncbi:MAG: aminoacyl-histidine dipeptidase [Alistipes sp.]|nr:aminoacyl-histidine dipeptidase [Alistipes sp.]
MLLKDLQPQAVWEQFEALTHVPRPSKKEERVIEYLIDFARRHGIEWQRDAIGNVVMRKPATEGYESRPTVILQSHMDMVCEKNSDVVFDFERDAIRAVVDGDWVRAEGTTLGADDGIGMAASMALLLDDEAQHGALEVLFTVDEETGLTGAFNLGEGMLTGKYLINLDSEDEGEIFIGCAGGVDTVATFALEQEAAPAEYSFYRVDVKDLVGGHSGDDINKGRANSNKLIARLMLSAQDQLGARVSRIEGGNLRNAIPREAYAVVGVPKENAAAFDALVQSYTNNVKAMFATTEPDMNITFGSVEGVTSVLTQDLQSRLLTALVSVPNGVIAMSQAVEGLVETSTNLASVKFVGEQIVVTTSQRSSVESDKHVVKDSVHNCFEVSGAAVEHSDGYPGWEPNPDSELLKRTVESYEALFGVTPKVRAVHAGLECGLFLEKYPHLEMVSFGPTVTGVHSPDERINIATVEKFWLHLKDLLTRI